MARKKCQHWIVNVSWLGEKFGEINGIVQEIYFTITTLTTVSNSVGIGALLNLQISSSPAGCGILTAQKTKEHLYRQNSPSKQSWLTYCAPYRYLTFWWSSYWVWAVGRLSTRHIPVIWKKIMVRKSFWLFKNFILSTLAAAISKRKRKKNTIFILFW